MRYLLSVIDDRTNSATTAEMASIDGFNAKLVAGGHWVFACGLAAPSSATVIDGRGPVPVSSDGPFLESEEYVSGFWIVEATDHLEAIELATEGSKCCNRRIELRPFFGG